MQFPRRNQPPKKPNQFIFDADMGNRIDSVLALAVVYGHAVREESEADVAGVATSKASLGSAAFCDAMQRFFERPKMPPLEGNAPPTVFSKIGYRMDGNSPESTGMLDAVLGETDSDGQPAFARGVSRLPDVADSVATYRDAIAGMPEGSIVIVLAGPATSLARVLPLARMTEGITDKVRTLVVAMGRYPSGADPTHVGPDIAAAQRVFDEWPGPIVACGAEVGEQLQFPAESIESDFGWRSPHIVAEAYRAYQTMPYDAAAWETAAALYAVQPEAGHFGLSVPGRIRVADDGSVSFEESDDGRHRYLTLDPAKRDQAVAAMRDLASTEPLPVPPPPAEA